MTRWIAVVGAVLLAAGCTGGNKKACDNIFKITSGGAPADKGGAFLEMCRQNQTTERLGIYCKNPQALLDCAAAAADKDGLGRCKEQCQRKDCKAVVEAQLAKAPDRFDDATQEAMLKKAETDLSCHDAFTFP